MPSHRPTFILEKRPKLTNAGESEVWSGEARDISVNDSVWGLEERGTQRERVQNVQGGDSQGVRYIR